METNNDLWRIMRPMEGYGYFDKFSEGGLIGVMGIEC